MDDFRQWFDLLARYRLPADSDQAERLEAYRRLLCKWNARISLTGSTEWSALMPHFEEALWAARLVPAGTACHLDIGSGGGFPAIPMKILNPGTTLTLVESRERKAVFLETVARELGLEGVSVRCARLGAVLAAGVESPGWDRVSWKAVRLTRTDWSALLKQCSGRTQFLLFHGESLPVEDEDEFRARVLTDRRLPVPNRRQSWLSILHPRPERFRGAQQL